MLYHNISPFCEPLSFVHQRITFNANRLLFLLLCHTNFMLYFIWIFFCLGFRPYFFALPYKFYAVFSYKFLHFYQGFRHCFYFIQIFFLCMNFLPYLHMNFTLHFFHTNFSPLFCWRLPRLFCFYNLTKVSSYTLLHAVPLKQWIWL